MVQSTEPRLLTTTCFDCQRCCKCIDRWYSQHTTASALKSHFFIEFVLGKVDPCYLVPVQNSGVDNTVDFGDFSHGLSSLRQVSLESLLS